MICMGNRRVGGYDKQILPTLSGKFEKIEWQFIKILFKSKK